MPPNSPSNQPSESESTEISWPEPQDPHIVPGNASFRIKEHLCDLLSLPTRNLEFRKRIFAPTCMARLRLTDVSVRPMPDEPMKEEGRVVLELVVHEDMLNLADSVHGGCTAYLIDFCSSLALVALRTKQLDDEIASVTVSQCMNVVFHSPAFLGDTLRIVNTTITMGTRVMTARTEIWNQTHRRLVATGVHVKMDPSPSKAKL